MRDDREKLSCQIAVRIDEPLRRRIDAYVMRRSRASGLAMNRAMAVREILEARLFPTDEGSEAEVRARE